MQKWSELLPQNSLQRAAALSEKAQSERDAGRTIYPPQSQIFRALTLTPPEQVRVVIVGQDPYHGPGQANGLAFSVNPGVPLPPSLRNIFREMREDIGAKMPESGDLTPWAERGVLLLNTIHTVQDGQANSHKNWGWQDFVLDVFRSCAALPQPVVFILWGRQAQAFVSSLPLDGVQNKKVLCSSHPSPLGAAKGSANVPAFLGSRPFSKTNQLLQEMGAEPINWEM